MYSKSSSQRKEILKAFVPLFFDFLEFSKSYSNKNQEFMSFYKKCFMLKKTNVRMFIQLWYTHISAIYFKQIMDGNVEYFLCKDYNDEIEKGKSVTTDSRSGTSNIIADCIVHMKELYYKLDDKVVKTFISHMQKLSYLSVMYYNS